MRTIFNRTIFSTGVAIFSMFFGAGNVVFPLVLGTKAGDQISFALIGLMITAIVGPLLGMLGAVLFQGKSTPYFTRIGKVPGLFLMMITLCFLGPLAVMPRCLTVAYAGIKPIFPEMTLMTFSLIFAGISWLCCINKNRVIPLLGYVLSPLLLGCLLLIIIKGKMGGSAYPALQLSSKEAMFAGLSYGYDTMDLIASLFFSATIRNMLQTKGTEPGSLFKTAMISGAMGGFLLAIIYVGLSQVAALNQHLLTETRPEELITTLASFTLGPVMGMAANIAIILACLTTVIGLATTISGIIAQEFWPREGILLTGFLVVTALLANLGFEAIMLMIHPMVAICYPAIIVLTLCNIGYKTHGFESVKLPVGITLACTVIYYALQ